MQDEHPTTRSVFRRGGPEHSQSARGADRAVGMVTADTTPTPHRSLLHDTRASVEADHGNPDHVLLRVDAPSAHRDQSAGARLLCAAVSEARSRDAWQLPTVLQVAAPTCWTHCEAFRARVSDGAESVPGAAQASVSSERSSTYRHANHVHAPGARPGRAGPRGPSSQAPRPNPPDPTRGEHHDRT